MWMRVLLLLLSVLALTAVGQEKQCHGADQCNIGDRSYHIKLPDDWDGMTPLPVLMHFHGWGRQGDLIIQHQRISGHTRRRGVLLIAPNGRGATWDFWTSTSRDVPFAAAVIEDAAKRFPIDRDKIFVSGYSYGAAMAWRYACENGDGVAALLAISGTLAQTERCSQAPQEVRHVHGLADTVMDFPMGPSEDQTYPVKLWRDMFGCDEPKNEGAWQAVNWLTLDRHEWDCAKGAVTLDIHDGGHFIPHGWIGWQLDQLMGRPPQYP